MIVWAVLALALCGVLPTRAEVVDNFNNKCSQFFYKKTEPLDFDEEAYKICQKYDNLYFFASLYSTTHRIPLYSAYTFNYRCTKQERRHTGKWFIEPQLSVSEDTSDETLTVMRRYSESEVAIIKAKQAVDDDYKYTGYDKGHLNPNSYQCDQGRDATFTLTNSAPMDACFNRIHWKEWETAVRKILEEQSGGIAFLVTGTVPSDDNKIPKPGISDNPSQQDFNRVTVPTYIWTAVCYSHPVDEETFSFGYIGVNKPDGIIEVTSITLLTKLLSDLYKRNNLQIFSRDCLIENSQKRKSEDIVKKLYNKVQLPMENRVIMSPHVKNILHTVSSHFDEYPTKKFKITDIKAEVIYKSTETLQTSTEDIKFASGLSCVLDTPFTEQVTGELRRKRETSQQFVCTLKPEVLGDCSTSCLYTDQAKDYYCSTGSVTVRCSPTYSDITVEGERCRSDHTCGRHGQDYYWCYITESKWNYCSPPLPLGKTRSGPYCDFKRNCAYYGYRYLWCDIGDSWDYCTR